MNLPLFPPSHLVSHIIHLPTASAAGSLDFTIFLSMGIIQPNLIPDYRLLLRIVIFPRATIEKHSVYNGARHPDSGFVGKVSEFYYEEISGGKG
jgi:hypothetical protein